MTNSSDTTGVNLNCGVLEGQSVSGSRRKSSPESNESQDLRRACQEFEEIFLRMLLKEARIDRSMLSGEGVPNLYGDLSREALAKAMAQAGGLGLADVLYRQLSSDELPASGTDHPGVRDSTRFVKTK